MALLEIAGVASIMPFLSVLGNPEVVETNPVLSALYKYFGFSSVSGFLVVLGVAAFVLILFSATFRSITQYAMHRFVEMRRHSIGERLLETYLRQPYDFFLDRHSSDLAKSILSEVDLLVGQVFRPGMQMVAYGVVLVAIVIFLVAINPVVAGAVAVTIGLLYTLIYLIVRGLLSRIGEDRLLANQGRFTAAGEALGGIKDIKLLGREYAYLKRFRGPSIRQARHQATNQTLAQVPRFLIEAVAFGGILAIALILTTFNEAGNGGLGNVLPMLGLYAFAGYRMLPAAQNVFQGMTQLRFGSAAVDNVYQDLRQRTALAQIQEHASQALIPRESITLQSLSYTYPNATSPALRDINLTIPVGSSIGLVGGTGAGKTTLVDVLLGLLKPTEGHIRVDENVIGPENLRSWQRALGYVPQDIFLTDSSITENIAFGVPAGEIDQEQVVHCARMAHVHDFIMTELPDQYETMVGERGVRLSGGQRQRIGIARALYHDPPVLVLDEATSALDTVTERSVMQAIEELAGAKTIILIAHRLSTVRRCDQVVLLDKGQVLAAGSFDELRERVGHFQEMVESS